MGDQAESDGFTVLPSDICSYTVSTRLLEKTKFRLDRQQAKLFPQTEVRGRGTPHL